MLLAAGCRHAQLWLCRETIHDGDGDGGGDGDDGGGGGDDGDGCQ